MKRKRVNRRARARLEAKEINEFQRALTDRGIMARIAKVRAAVAPSAPLFWHIIKRRLAARETFSKIHSLDVVRDIAMAILRDDGHDLTGVILKVFWRPPVLAFDPVPDHEDAIAVVDQVRGTDRGRQRQRQLAALLG